jgi:hypothetical protein
MDETQLCTFSNIFHQFSINFFLSVTDSSPKQRTIDLVCILTPMAQTVMENRGWHQPSSKSASDWSGDELVAFRIEFVSQDSANFFGIDPLPDPPISVPDTILCTVASDKKTQNIETYRFLRLMERAMRGPTKWECAVGDFSRNVFELMHYDEPGFILQNRFDSRFRMCGEKQQAQTNVCVMDENEILLVLKEAKRELFSPNAESQLVAEAIAAFCHNNDRRRELACPELTNRIMSGMTMEGTSPTFYKLLITQHLVDCVKYGKCPEEATICVRHVPAFPDGHHSGMISLRNRRLVLSSYEAFKAFVFRDHAV